MTSERHLPILRRNSWFAGLPEEMQLEIAEHGRSRHVAQGADLFVQGDPSAGLHCLLEGQLHVTGLSPDGEEVLIAILRPSDWTGFLSVLDRGPYAFTASAVTASTVLSLSPGDLARVFERSIGTYKHLVAPELSSTRGNFHFYLEQLGKPPLQRVAHRLLDLGRWAYGAPLGPPMPLENVSQDDLAAATRLSRQTINGALRDLEKRGVIEVRRAHVRVLDADALRQVASGPE
ncbi:Crp/Fnr family transcriptional regulator [Erythrobacter donghaensis]|uniref:Crp/Fnr family transcriptional regulator n=1 Tax=Erythrobacter donghaensis TaxID=267135 RepID=UPI001180122D|nr:Crp/Fnr family transcriptional regulator [Erythrobacter donghaensis]